MSAKATIRYLLDWLLDREAWRVHHKDGKITVRLRYGYACVLAEIFGGEVLHDPAGKAVADG